MTKHRCRTRWEHSKSDILLDDNARHDPRSSSVFGAQQHLCKRSSALAVLTRPDKAPKEKKTRATKNIGAERVSIFATDQCSYGNHIADRKSTI